MNHRVSTAIALTIIAGAVTAAHQTGTASAGTATPLVGAWTLNKDLSDPPRDGSPDDREGNRRGARRGGFGGGVGGRRGGGGGGRGGSRGDFDSEQMARAREALREITNTPQHLTIVQTDIMIILTAQDGRTTRLSPDGKKIKDESTKLERKTKWDGPTLVSEITGLAGMKITESYSVDPERRQLRVTVRNDNDRRPLMINRVYDADPN